MDFDQYKEKFLIEASNSGYSQQNITKCLNYASVLFSNNVPVIYNISHLSALVGYNQKYLKKASARPRFYYRDFFILKKNGQKRLISEPLPSLKEIQIWILQNILNNVNVSPYAKAYKPKVNLNENLRYHKSQPKVLALDVENFFPSIKQPYIEKLFSELGYSPILSNLLSRLCCKDNCLPQGAPTSPYLSNIYFKSADNIISLYCNERKIKYTRYADDLTFSGIFDEKEMEEKVKITIDDLNLNLNHDKTKVMTPNTRQTVTGIVVNVKPQVVFHKRNELRNSMYFIINRGLEEHIKFRGIQQSNYLERILGQVCFVLQINPDDKEFQDYKAYLIELKKRKKDSLINIQTVPPTVP